MLLNWCSSCCVSRSFPICFSFQELDWGFPINNNVISDNFHVIWPFSSPLPCSFVFCISEGLSVFSIIWLIEQRPRGFWDCMLITWFASISSSNIYNSGNTFADWFYMNYWFTKAATLFVSLAIRVLILEGVFLSASLKHILAADISLNEKAGKIRTWQRTLL